MLKDLLMVLLLALGYQTPAATQQPITIQVPEVPTESAVLIAATDDKSLLIKNIENLMLSYQKDLGKVRAHAMATTVVSSSTKVGIDPIWIVAMMWQESRFDYRASSPDGAIGLMQILPSTGRSVGYSRTRLWNPHNNIKAGVTYLASQKRTFGNIKKATTAYNQGSTRVRKGTARMWYYNDVNRHYLKMKGWIKTHGQKQQPKPRVV